MATKNPGLSKNKPEAAPTNLRQIKGINQLIEARLHRQSIKTLEQLVKLSPKEIHKALGTYRGLSAEQIEEQDWIGQARKLLEEDCDSTIASEGFIVNLFLNKNKQVSSTQVLHVNNDVGEKWDGWDSQRLLTFIISSSGLSLPQPKVVLVEAKPSEVLGKNLVNPRSVVEKTKRKTSRKPKLAVTPIIPLLEKSEAEEIEFLKKPATGLPKVKPILQPTVLPDVFFRTLDIIPSRSSASSQLSKGEPFDVRLSIDFAELLQKSSTSLNYQAMLFAKSLDARELVNLGQAQGKVVNTDDAIVVNIPKQDLQPGLYRLEASVTLSALGVGSKSVTNPAHSRTIFQVF